MLLRTVDVTVQMHAWHILYMDMDICVCTWLGLVELLEKLHI